MLLNLFLKLLVLSWRVRFTQPDLNKPVVISLWHCDLPACLAAFKRQNIAVLISQSRDGGIFAELAKSLGYSVFRGSGSKGQESIRHLLRALKNGNSAGMALDGPRGPAGIAKAGAAWLAEKSGVPLVQVQVEYGRRITLRSWDKTKIPLPFSRVQVTVKIV